ncbi:MAG: ATP-binding protein [Proteobacteria bacterium]|nr:ATP-binding protein [Pseudomonadota bacterium]
MMFEEFLARPEGKTLEFKRNLSSSRPALCTLVAFANSAGGRLVIGVEDGSKNVVGIEHPLDLERHIANLIADSIQPSLLPEIEIVPWPMNACSLSRVRGQGVSAYEAPPVVGI